MFSLAGLDLDHFSAVVVTTICTNPMRYVLLTAIGARDQVTRLEGVVGPAAVSAAFRYFTLRKRWHTITPLTLNTEPANWAG